MPILRPESITYGVEDVARCIKYFEDFGLEAVERGSDGAIFRTLENQTVHIRAASDRELPPALQPGSTLRLTVWGVNDAAGLDAIGAELSRDREVRRDASGLLRAEDESGLPLAFCVARPEHVPVQPPQSNFGGVANRVNSPLPRFERVSPLRLVHVVFHIRKELRERAGAFYRERLGFRLSDRSVDAGDFMRCHGSRDHHNLLLLHRADRVEFNHVAFEVRGIDEIMIGGLHMKDCGWKATRRPGRHFIGSNFHWFFENPCGGRTEFIADMDCLDEKWVPRIFEKHPGESIWLYSAD
jgi:catechol 2,3-dioxygenase-like lactoylglutathione lyase family enzyme